MFIKPLYTDKTLPLLYSGRVHLSFKGCRVHFAVLSLLFVILCLMAILLAHNVDPDQTPHYVASVQGLHCLPMTFLRVSRLEMVNCKRIERDFILMQNWRQENGYTFRGSNSFFFFSFLCPIFLGMSF